MANKDRDDDDAVAEGGRQPGSTRATRDAHAGQRVPEDMRARVHETFGKVALAIAALPRYRHQSIADLYPLILEPLMRDRIAIAAPAKESGPNAAAFAGITIWASVSKEVDAKIREQIAAGVFPIRLKPEDWTSGDITWLLDVIAPNKRLAAAVIRDFQRIVSGGTMHIHPVVTRQVDPEVLKRMTARPAAPEAPAQAKPATAPPRTLN